MSETLYFLDESRRHIVLQAIVEVCSYRQYLWKEAEVEASIQYVVNEQGLPLSVFENKNRTFNMDI